MALGVAPASALPPKPGGRPAYRGDRGSPYLSPVAFPHQYHAKQL